MLNNRPRNRYNYLTSNEVFVNAINKGVVAFMTLIHQKVISILCIVFTLNLIAQGDIISQEYYEGKAL